MRNLSKEPSAERWENDTSGDMEADRLPRVKQGALKGSNVSAVETMVAMIAAARQFEQQMKMLQTAEQKEQAATNLPSTAAS